MKKYVKPMVEVVSLKSSDDIAAPTTYKGLRQSMVKSYLEANNKIPVSLYGVASMIAGA